MTSEHLGNLCCLIIEDLYGSFLAHIFGQLAYHGRLLSQHVAQRCRLPLRQVKAGLAALVQLRLVQHYSTADGYSSYQTNLIRAYDLLRIGKLSSLARKNHGPIAVKVLKRLAAVGFSTASDLIMAIQGELMSDDEEIVENQDRTSERRIFNAMNSLAEDDFLARVQPAQSHIVFDARRDADEHVTAHPPDGKDTKLKGKKALEQQTRFVDAEMEQRLDAYLAPHVLKKEMEAGLTNLNGTQENKPDELYICINYARIVRSTRDEIFTQHLIKTFGEPYAKIGKAVLNQVDLKPQLSSANLDIALAPRYLSLSGLITDLETPVEIRVNGGSGHTNGWHHNEKMTNGVTNNTDDLGREDVVRHLAAIAEGPYRLLHEDGDTWQLRAATFRQFLLRQEIMKMARQQVGVIGVRLMRMLIDKGRLDEKILQETGLLNAKEMRQTLAKLHTKGFIELQEVPRDPQRQPNRTIFLWFYDEYRVQKALLEYLYKTMARLYQRVQVERDKMKLTIEKVERLDCEGREEDYMTKAEVLVLQQFRRKERWLLGEVSRLDDSVALLRDL